MAPPQEERTKEVPPVGGRKHCEYCGRDVHTRAVRRRETFLIFGREAVVVTVRIRMCSRCGAHLYDHSLDQANFRRAYDRYRRRHRLPFPAKIRDFRRRHRLSVDALGELLGCSAATIRHWEAGVLPPPELGRRLRGLVGSGRQPAA